MKQINKTIARKLYAENKPFIIVPCNMRPDDSRYAVYMKKGWMIQTFENFYNQFCYYNCNNETGRYPRFYIDD